MTLRTSLGGGCDEGDDDTARETRLEDFEGEGEEEGEEEEVI